MASRSGNKSTGSRRASSQKRGKSSAKGGWRIVLRPEHQRELFALGLMLVAVLTIIFAFTGEAGGLGTLYLNTVRSLFGAGVFFVPLTLFMIGLAILWQERMHDASLSGANVLGTGMILLAMLGLLEVPVHSILIADRMNEGGGWIGYWLLELLQMAIGQIAAVLVILALGLAGLLLTFNLTVRELVVGMVERTIAFRQVLWSAPRRSQSSPATLPRSGVDLVFSPPPQGESDDIVPTPIAARPTRASLFQRPTPELPPPAREPVVAAKPVTSVKPEPVQEVVQEPLDGFEISPVRRAWPLPSLELLLERTVDGGITDEERRLKARVIEETLASFKVEARVVGVNTGPAVTQFELQPAVGVKVAKITTLERDLALALAAQSIRIEAPIPGKNVVGIEIPNSAIAMVSLREVLDSEEFETFRGRLKLPLGKDVSGTPVIADLTKMPHLLVAGATGSGKSVAINAFLCGLLLKHTPDELKLILIDPKMVEMIVYNHIPHLLSPVVTEVERVVPTLKWATREMERRYKIFARNGCRNIDSYRQLMRKRADLEPMPYIVIVIDELADLMMMAADEVETYICRLAQMARATGIHLIIATQRPSVDVITGLIKANFPSRIAFAVTSQVDSRVILDVPGAEHLLGRGDMLYMAADSAKLIRIQGTYVADREVERIVEFWRHAAPPTEATAAQPNTATGEGKAAEESSGAEPFRPPAEFLSPAEQDELLPQAIALVGQHQRASASLLQRRLRIGYSKAQQLIDLLEQQGYVGPAEEGRSREVLKRNGSATS
ncbi:FtsK/SpoIIIE family DNA translocase [Chloroflexus sp.]|uniref:FtsK/SpoIIIE family DNA translocase n=1 Tax=Chloroflexus sp. TaxID=1904827 RepID=UPI002ADD6B0D|nr:DNA translocase FtsK 4TM domain-containing protein [Chloroflexus sp.]